MPRDWNPAVAFATQSRRRDGAGKLTLSASNLNARTLSAHAFVKRIREPKHDVLGRLVYQFEHRDSL
jgi:hypothetical protein